jgi:hypothetical protein
MCEKQYFNNSSLIRNAIFFTKNNEKKKNKIEMNQFYSEPLK